MKGLPLSDMKKVSEDKKSATFKHKDGHEIRIAIGSLSPDMRKKLSSLPIHAAEGVDTDENEPVPTPLPAPTPDVGIPMDAADVALKFAGIPGSSQEPEQADKAIDNPQPPQDTLAANQKPTPQTAAQAPTARAVDQNSAATPPPPADAVAPGSMPARTPQEASANMLSSIDADDKAWQHDLNNGHISPKTYADLLYKNPDGTEKSTLGKVGSLFALMVGGAGAGLAHQPNMLLEMMNKEIDRDIEAQKQSKSNAFTLHGQLMQHELQQAQIKQMNSQIPLTQAQTNNMKAEAALKANTLTRIHTNNAYLKRLSDTVAKLPQGSPEWQKANDTLVAVSQAVDQQNTDLEYSAASKAAFLHQLMGPQNGAPSEQNFQHQTSGMRMLGPIGESRAKDLEEKHIPGLPGSASVPVDKADREKIRNMQQFDDAVKNVRSWAQKHSGLGNQLNVADRNYGRTQLMNLQSLYREGQGMGQLKGFDVPLLEKEIGTDPMSVINSITNDKKLQAAQDANRQKFEGMKKSLGLPQENSQAPDIRYDKQGNAWQMGPGGKPVRVK